MADFNRRFSDNDPCWLVKVDSRILGPYSFNEIVLKLTSSEFKSFHECISPMDRWRPLQSQPLFIAAVERLKKQQDTGPSEFTFTKTERTNFTRTLDITSATPTPLAEEITDKKPRIKSSSIAAPPLELDTSNKVKVQTSQKAPSTTTLIKKTAFPWVSVLSLVLLLGVGGYLFSIKTKKEAAPIIETKNPFLAFVDKGLEHRKIADWSEALKYFRKAQAINNKDVDLIFEAAPLHIQVENQAMMARGMLEKVMSAQYKKENVVLGHTLLGLSYAYDSQYKMAVKYYDEALKNEETYYPALVNRGFALTMMEQYEEAERTFSQAMQIQPNNATAYLYLLQAYVFHGMKKKDKIVFDSAYTFANRISDRFYDGKQEILFLKAYAAFRLGKDANTVVSLLKSAFMVDPDQTTDHLHSPAVDWRGFQWSYLHQICNELSGATKNEDQFFVKFICSYKMNSEIQALQVAEGWALKSPNSAMPQVAQAIVRNKLGEIEKAKLSLDVANHLKAKDMLFYQMRVKVCAKVKDEKCLSESSEQIAHTAPLHSYLARAVGATIKNSDNRQWIVTGLRESNNYIPLLRMQ